LLLAPRDLPAGYVSDDALENADATARTRAYPDLVAQSAFAGYRGAHAALVQYVARLRSRAAVAPFLAGEGAAVDRTRGAARVTLAARYGDRPALAYQVRGSRGEEWVVAVFADGPYVAMLGAYDAAGEQRAIDTLQRLAALADARLRAAAAHAPDPAPRPEPPLRIVSLVTTTRQGRAAGVFRPHSPVSWRVVWRLARVSRGAREMLREWVWRGKTTLYRNSLTDRPFAGDNVLIDGLRLGGVTPGTYDVTVGRLTARATRAFQVVPARPARPSHK
jgi:hypothetical protein